MKAAESLSLTRYSDGHVECDLDTEFAAIVERVAAATRGCRSFSDLAEKDPAAAYDYLREAIQVAYMNPKRDGTTPIHIDWDSTAVYDKESDLGYDPTEIAKTLVLGNMLPDRNSTRGFELSIGTPTTEEDREVLGKEAVRIELCSIKVEPNDYAF